MKRLAKIYQSLMDKHGISKILVLRAEDETSIKKVVAYDQKEDRLVGFCDGKKTNENDHLQHLSIVLGNDENTYKMVDSFDKHDIAGYPQVIFLNPVHPSLIQLVFLSPTYNRFTSEDVRLQWELISTQYKRFLEHIK